MADKQQTQMTIGRVAAAAGVAATTLRFYERAGLLTPTDRSPAGYRLYDSRAVERLRFIRSAQSVGFSLQDIKTLLALDERTSCDQVRGMIEERLADVAHRIAELKSVERTLRNAAARCRKSRVGCAVLVDLHKIDRRTKH